MRKSPKGQGVKGLETGGERPEGREIPIAGDTWADDWVPTLAVLGYVALDGRVWFRVVPTNKGANARSLGGWHGRCVRWNVW